MLVNFNKERRVLWYNPYLSKKMAEKCLAENTVWIDSSVPAPKEIEGMRPYLMLTEDMKLDYGYEPTPQPEYTEIQTIMQAIADLELLILEGGMGNV